MWSKIRTHTYVIRLICYGEEYSYCQQCYTISVYAIYEFIYIFLSWNFGLPRRLFHGNSFRIELDYVLGHFNNNRIFYY